MTKNDSGATATHVSPANFNETVTFAPGILSVHYKERLLCSLEGYLHLRFRKGMSRLRILLQIF